MKKIHLYLFVLCFSAMNLQFVWAEMHISPEDKGKVQVLGGAVISGIGTAFSNADVALCKSLIYPPHLKGDLGETLAGKYMLEYYCRNTGQWKVASSRFGRQGIDQIYIKYDSLGCPKDIMVGEVKYGKSRLSATRDGIQAGSAWTSRRLTALGARYEGVAKSPDIKITKPASIIENRHEIRLEMKNGRKVRFWRESAKSDWNFDGSPKDLPLAIKQAESVGRYLKAAGNNVIRVRRRVIEIRPEKDQFRIIVKNASGLDKGLSQGKLGITGEFSIKKSAFRYKELQTEVARQLKLKLGHLSDKECLDLTNDILGKTKHLESIGIQKAAFAKSVAYHAGRAGLAGALFSFSVEGFSQIIEGKPDINRLVETGASGLFAESAGTGAGQLVTAGFIKNKICYNAMQKTASFIGLKNAANIAKVSGGIVGSGVASILTAYGGYFLGQYDSYTANKLAVTGVIGSAGGCIAIRGAQELIKNSEYWGWAATGELSETALLFGIGAIATVVVTGVGLYGFNLYEEAEQKKLLELKLQEFQQNDSYFEKYSNSLFYGLSN